MAVETWNSAHNSYRKNFFLRKHELRATIVEKLAFHVDCPHISSIPLFSIIILNMFWIYSLFWKILICERGGGCIKGSARILERVISKNFWVLYSKSYQWYQNQFCKQGNRGDIGKNPRDTAVFRGSGRHDHFVEKTKNTFLDKVNWSMCAKF